MEERRNRVVQIGPEDDREDPEDDRADKKPRDYQDDLRKATYRLDLA